MKTRKILAWLLIVSMLLTGLLLTGCKKNKKDDDDDEKDVAEEDLSPTFGGVIKNFNGQKFNVLTKQDTNATGSFNVVELVADNNLGDASIVKAVTDRNQLIEDNFDVKITRTKSSNVAGDAQSLLKGDCAGTDAFMLSVKDQLNIAFQGGLLNLYQAPFLNIDQPWWDQGYAETLSLAGGVYFISGDCNTVDKDATYCTLFNEKLLEDTGLGTTAEQLYATAIAGIGNRGGFTMNVLNSLASTHMAASANVNYWDPECEETGYYGLYTQSEMTEVILQAGGFSATEVDPRSAVGIKSSVNAEFEQAVVEVKNQFGAHSGQVWFCNLDNHTSGIPTFWDTHARGTFKSNRATFFMCHVGTIDNVRDMTADFGVLPIGKLYDSQTDYYNTVQYYNCTSYSIPNRSDIENERSSYVLEIMAYYSSEQYKSDQSLAYTYDTRVLRAKGVRDENAWKMLDLIFDNRRFDLIAAGDSLQSTYGVYNAVRSASQTEGATAFQASRFSNLDSIISQKLQTLRSGA